MATPATPSTCFHHTDRETGRACTRCGRPACPECLIQASVGSQCFECVKADRPPRSARVNAMLGRSEPYVTYALIAVTAIAYLVITMHDAGISTFEARIGARTRWQDQLALFGPAVNDGDYYRLLSHSLVHYGILHIAFNMFILWQVGKLLEPAAGHLRYFLLYIVSVLGGACGALILDPHALTGGASGGVFGLMAAATLVLTRQGMSFAQTGFGPLLVLNLFLGFFISNVSIGGHIGGLVAGALATEALLQSRQAGKPQFGIVGVCAVGAAAVIGGLIAAGQ
jgi:membrane associated rhomboid family serine protease